MLAFGLIHRRISGGIDNSYRRMSPDRAIDLIGITDIYRIVAEAEGKITSFLYQLPSYLAACSKNEHLVLHLRVPILRQ